MCLLFKIYSYYKTSFSECLLSRYFDYRHISILQISIVSPQRLLFYPTALKGCRGIVFMLGVQMGGRAVGKSLSGLYLRNRKV